MRPPTEKNAPCGRRRPGRSTGAVILLLSAYFVGWLSFAPPALSSQEDVVGLDSGAVSGRVVDGVRVFLGIPYAAPPVGELRWKAPQRPAPWDGVREGAVYGPACPQSGLLESASREDCLYLNVWAPAAQRGEKLPVMVWIHGGGFNFGAPSQPEYEGSALARQGVVVVTVGYRLGPLGFLVHPKLPAESQSGTAGNYGLLDQIAAFAWVQRNIETFGGDPGRVTAFGQSAGSRSVSLLTLSPLADHLFHRAIAESGGPIIGSEYLTPAFNGDMAAVSGMGRQLSARLGCDTSSDELACMRSKTAMEVVTAADCRTSIFEDGLFFAPVFDGVVLPRDPAAASLDGSRPRVPLIMGSTGNEGTSYLRGEPGLTRQTYETFLAARFGAKSGEALTHFPAMSDADAPRAIDRVITVAVNAQPARYLARSLERAGGKAYLYRFTRKPATARANAMGAFHGVDLAYVFGNMKASDGYTDVDRELSRQVMAYWVNFARTGDPNGPGLVEWPVYRAAADASLEFADSVRQERHLYQSECDFIDHASRFGLDR
jgi:para-nitrobenzyl esterase